LGSVIEKESFLEFDANCLKNAKEISQTPPSDSSFCQKVDPKISNKAGSFVKEPMSFMYNGYKARFSVTRMECAKGVKRFLPISQAHIQLN